MVTASLGRLSTALTQASTAAGRLRTSAQLAGTAASQLRSSADQAAGAVQRAGRNAATSGGLMGGFRKGLEGATVAQRGLNTAMKANILGAIIAIVMMLVTKLIDMAMQSETVRKVMQAVFKKIGEAVGWAMDFVTKEFGKWNRIRADVVEVIGRLGDWLQDKWNQITGRLKAAWDGLSGFARSAFEAVLSAVRGPINAVIGLVNSAIRGLNSVRVSIPDWVPGVGGKTFGVNLALIPQLAAGGIAMPAVGGRLVTVAEAGQPEAIVPLSKLPDLLDLRPRRGAEQPITVNVYPQARQSEYEIGRIVARELAWAGKR
ncbi:hypothetical protein Prum_096160 [Phytohabitans rumicis]|uniref:Uncharacterized protein n=1 Tax=Phytohabitans rumicis TaxID=1076125 RepID=A0A6V8LIF9_9ACTN|nr:hypothetical protein Prum_096160 [Phytohabitans rumicis]